MASQWPAGQGVGTFYLHLGRSDRFIAAADLAFGLRWREHGETSQIRQEMMEYVADLDVHGDRLLLTGLRRDEAGELGSDGSTAWIASLREGGDRFRPILPFRRRKLIENCAGFGLAAVGFLSEGSFVIAPGAEADVYRYDPDGRLQRTWSSAELGVTTDCDFPMEQQSLLSTDVVARQQWINRRRIIDEIVELPEGPALIVRSAAEKRIRWELVLLTAAGHETRTLPFTSPSPWAYVSADSRGSRVAFLIADWPAGRDGSVTPRLVVMTMDGR